MTTPYPATICRARYQGTYSGATWHAWNCKPDKVQMAAYGGDLMCADFWRVNKEGHVAIKIGLGNTPQEALDDLAMRLELDTA